MANTFKKNSPICPHFTQQVKCEGIVKELSNSLPSYSVGTFGALFKSTHQFAGILPSRSMAITFKKNSPIHPHFTQWVKCKRIANELSNSLQTYLAGPLEALLKEFITSPMRYVLKELAGYFLKVPSHVITMCPVGSFQCTHNKLSMQSCLAMKSQSTHWV